MTGGTHKLVSENIFAITNTVEPGERCNQRDCRRCNSTERSDKQTKIPTAVYHVTTNVIKI